MSYDRIERETARTITRRATPWYKKVDWLPMIFIGGIVGAWLVFVSLIFFTSVFDASSSPTAAQHYNSDFKRYCSTLYDGHAYVGNRDICMNTAGKVVMREGHDYYLNIIDQKKPLSSTQHYNKDFVRFCHANDGHAVVGTRNICVDDNRIIMRESK